MEAIPRSSGKGVYRVTTSLEHSTVTPSFHFSALHISSTGWTLLVVKFYLSGPGKRVNKPF